MRTAAGLGANLSSPARSYAITPLATVSRGYDSPAACVIARHAGCRQAVTIVNATSVMPRSDDGSAIAARLGMECRRYRHDRSAYRYEETIWATNVHGGALNLSLPEYPRPLCLLFTASYGDKVWDIHPHDLSDPHGDIDAMLSEFRLFAGVLHTVVPWWGILDAGQINALGASPRMRPWSVGGPYDRPVARRLVEQAGVPRELFGRRKLVTASNRPFCWPYSRPCRDSLNEYLRAAACTPRRGG